MVSNQEQASAVEDRLRDVLATPPYVEALAGIGALKFSAPHLDPRFVHDWLGGKTRRSFIPESADLLAKHGFSALTEGFAPSFSEDFYDWLDLLESVADGKDPYVFVELGAGFGRWAVHAAHLCRAVGRPLGRLTACEAEPTHYRWMLTHFRDNDVDPANHRLIEAAVAGSRGTIPFYAGAASSWYGQSIAQNVIDFGVKPRTGIAGLLRRLLSREKPQERVDMIPAIVMEDVLKETPKVHFMHIDIQGAEFDALEHSMDLLDRCVKRVHVGTHSPTTEATRGRDMDKLVGDLFVAHGWRPKVTVRSGETKSVHGHIITFVDGVQVWMNPAFS